MLSHQALLLHLSLYYLSDYELMARVDDRDIIAALVAGELALYNSQRLAFHRARAFAIETGLPVDDSEILRLVDEAAGTDFKIIDVEPEIPDCIFELGPNILAGVEMLESISEPLERIDNDPDTVFYSKPRFLHHICPMTSFQLASAHHVISPDPRDTCVLDMASSWISHQLRSVRYKRFVGMGLNEEELKANPILESYVVQDLNVDHKLPFADGEFDVVTCDVSIDYLVNPVKVLKETRRVASKVVLAWSNRMFPSKAVSIWRRASDGVRVQLAASYCHLAGFATIRGHFIAAQDPLWIVICSD